MSGADDADPLSPWLADARALRPAAEWLAAGPRLFAPPAARRAWRTERLAILAQFPSLARQLAEAATPRTPEPTPAGFVEAAGWSSCLPAAGLLAHLREATGPLEAVRDSLQALLSLQDWVPPHHGHSRPLDLSAATVVGHLALLLDLGRDLLAPAERRRIVAAIVERGVLPLVAMCRLRRVEWTRATHNWPTVIAGNIGLGLLAAWEHVPEPNAALAAVVERLARPLSAWPADGSYPEGPGYWQYGVGACLPAARALQLASGGALDLFRLPFLGRSGEYGLQVQTPDGGCFAVEDGASRWQAGWLLALLGAGLGRPDLASWGRLSLGTPAGGSPLRQVLHCPPPAVAPRPPAPAPQAFFPDTQNAMLRADWTGQAFFAGLHAGSNAVNHAHLDLGSFTVIAGGQRLLGDVGSWPYAVDSFARQRGGARWDYDANATAGHNALLVDGAGQDPGPAADASFDQVELRPDFGRALLSVELRRAYGGRLAAFRRHFAFLAEGVLVVCDQVDCGVPRKLTWCWHPSSEPQALAEADGWTWGQSGGACALRLAGLEGTAVTFATARRATRYRDRTGRTHVCADLVAQVETVHPVPALCLVAVVAAGPGAEAPAVRWTPEPGGLTLQTAARRVQLSWEGGRLAWL